MSKSEIYNKRIFFNDNHLGALIHFRGEVIRALMENGFSISLIAPSEYNITSNPIKGTNLFLINLDRTSVSIKNNFKYLCNVFKILHKNRPDVLINYTIKPILAGGIVAFILRIPSVSFFAGLNSSISNILKRNDCAARLYRGILRMVLSVNKYNIFLNKEDLELMTNQKVIHRTKATLFKGGEGVDISKYSPNENKKGKTDGLKLVMVGRVLKTKEYDEFVEAASKAKIEFHDKIEFYLCGGIDSFHPDRVNLEKVKEDEQSGAFKYMGHLKNITEFLSDADCVILPSYYNEGMNRSLMEALCMGIPIITTDNRGCRELVKDGITGFLIPPKDSKSLYEAVQKFMNLTPEERDTMGIESRKYALERFDVRKVIENYKSIIDNVVSDKEKK